MTAGRQNQDMNFYFERSRLHKSGGKLLLTASLFASLTPFFRSTHHKHSLCTQISPPTQAMTKAQNWQETVKHTQIRVSWLAGKKRRLRLTNSRKPPPSFVSVNNNDRHPHTHTTSNDVSGSKKKVWIMKHLSCKRRTPHICRRKAKNPEMSKEDRPARRCCVGTHAATEEEEGVEPKTLTSQGGRTGNVTGIRRRSAAGLIG